MRASSHDAVIVVTMVVFLLAGCGSSSRSSAPGPQVTATLQVGSSQVGSSEYDAAVDEAGNLWVIDRMDGTLWRIDAATNEVEEGGPL
jgi:DNA-binding beta-propeller fold protein YncE